MYKILTVTETVRVPPKRFNEELKEVIKSEFANAYNGKVVKNVGIILDVLNVNEISDGKIIMGDGAIYYDAELEILVFQPVLNEVIEGTVTELAEFGAFVNFGPLDGLIHLSQITEDFMSYDKRASVILGKETKKVLRVEDQVRARIVAISLKNTVSDSKIGLTMRQPYLGKFEWLEEERKKLEKKKVGEEKKKKTEEKEKKKKTEKKEK
ncbi:MAG: DNA-directed RNA polymerase [Candidatus Altiarchaeota archaeon]